MFMLLWERYSMFHLFVDRDFPGVVIPEDCPSINNTGITVFRLEPPLEGANWCDFDEDDQSLYITLSLAGRKCPLRIPWDSILIFGTDDFHVYWAASGAIDPTGPDKTSASMKPERGNHLKVVK